MIAETIQANDPTAMLIAGGAGCISILASILLTIIGSLVKGVKEELKSLRVAITGDGGLTVGLVTRITTLEGRVQTAETAIEALKRGTLTREVFETEMSAQNTRLDDLKADTSSLGTKVDKLKLDVAARPWSQSTMQAVRQPAPPDSDPPVPRPRRPSRPGE